MEANFLGSGNDPGSRLDAIRDRGVRRYAIANLTNLDVSLAVEVRREVEHARGTLDERVEASVVDPGEIARVSNDRRRSELIEQLKHRDGGVLRRSGRVNEWNDRVDDKPTEWRRTEKRPQLGKRFVRRRRTRKAARKVELEAEDVEALCRDLARDVEPEELTLTQNVLRVVEGEDRRALARPYTFHQKLQAGDAFPGAGCAAKDVRPAAHQPIELIVDGQESGRYKIGPDGESRGQSVRCCGQRSRSLALSAVGVREWLSPLIRRGRLSGRNNNRHRRKPAVQRRADHIQTREASDAELPGL